MLGNISDHPFMELKGLWPTKCGVKGVWNHSSPVDWCAKEVDCQPIMTLGGFWPTSYWRRTGVDIRAAWLGCINVFVVWVECVKVLLVNVCYGTAKSADIVSRDMWVSTGQHADCDVLLIQHSLNCDGVEFPFIYRFGCVGDFSKNCS